MKEFLEYFPMFSFVAVFMITPLVYIWREQIGETKKLHNAVTELRLMISENFVKREEVKGFGERLARLEERFMQ